MPRCCGGASCSCVIEEGPHIDIVGVGSPADPFVVTADVDLEAVDNAVFDVTVTGVGTVAAPWGIEVDYAATATLNDLPDVSTPTPTNGQVLGWDNALGQWTARNPTTAASGSVTTDTSLAGDGSAGTPLQVKEDPAGFLTTRTPGLGLTDAGINQTVRKFADAATRAAASPAPTLNTLSVLADAPGQIDYYTGTAWASAGGSFTLAPITGQEFYQMSGPYAGGRLTVMIQNVDQITDDDGTFDAIAPSDIAGRAGVMSATIQPISPGTVDDIAIPFTVMLAGQNGGIRGKAFRVDDGTPMGLTPLRAMVTAFLY